MNAVEIEQAVSALFAEPFDAETFPYAFLEAFGNKETTLKRLREGSTNKSDVPNGLLQVNNIHLATCAPGDVTQTLAALGKSAATRKHKAKFILATDGADLQAEDCNSGETLACSYADFPNHFGFFLGLAGISVVRQIREESFDIRATARLNRLYVELLKDNPDWVERRDDMNHFLARLIFCFYAEDTHIFRGDGLFTATIDQMSEKDGSNTAWVISEVFRAMNTPATPQARQDAGITTWANSFPYVNGGLFSGSVAVPRISKVARTYLLHIGSLDWKKINPDIFGSMIQAVADEAERGALGMHYTSRPNILKVLNPLFLDDVRAALAAAGQNPARLKALRTRLAKIRVFDPACGSGNFLVIAYKELRAIEAEINQRLQETTAFSSIPLTNFRGIELRGFAAEIARLALIIAEYQCDVQYLGEKLALDSFLPLNHENWITCGNALRLDWLSICPPTGTAVKLVADDLFATPLDQAEMDFANEGGETYICGNPPYKGSKWQDEEQKEDLKGIFDHRCKTWKSLDYVAGWFMKAADYGTHTHAAAAFVSTNSICQGQQVPILWPLIFKTGHAISFAHTSFKWANLASHNAGVTVVIVGISRHAGVKRLFSIADDGKPLMKDAENINAYLIPGNNIEIQQSKNSISNLSYMDLGNMPKDGGNLLFTAGEAIEAVKAEPEISKFIFDFVGSQEFVRGIVRRCLWIEEYEVSEATQSKIISKRLEGVRQMRLDSDAESTRDFANRPHRFKQIQGKGLKLSIVVPKVTSEQRPYLPVGILSKHSIVSDNAFALYDAPLWNLALIASRLHLVWIATVCGKLETRYRYSNTLGWNTFPVPFLTQNQKDDLTRCAENILIERERHFPATIADLYDPERMPENLRHAHDWNDEVLERIYIGRKFKNDTERLEKLFQMYTQITKKNESV